MRYVVGIDIGGTNIVAGTVAEDGSELLGLVSEPTIAEQGANAVVDRIAKLARASIGAARGKEIAGVGIGSPGPLNKIGRASCRERVENSVVDETTKIEGLDM